MCRLGVLANIGMLHWGSVGSSLSKATLLRLPESVNKQTNKQKAAVRRLSRPDGYLVCLAEAEGRERT